MNDAEVSAALTELSKSGVKGHLKAQIEALITLIPVAGSSLAAVWRQHREQKQQEKVLEVLTHLHSRTKGQEESLKKVITEDQATELIHETLSAAAIASDKDKLRMLKHGLANSFTSDKMDFGAKQIYMQITREMSVCEYALLEEVYSNDPYTKTISLPRKQDGIQGYFGVGVGAFTVTMPHYHERYENDSSAPKLRDFLQKRFKRWADGLVLGVAGRLDAKGLCSLGSNLESWEQTLVREEYDPLRATTVAFGISSMGTSSGSTPMGRSRTQLGREFLEFVRSS